jgi:hypothetical protein
VPITLDITVRSRRPGHTRSCCTRPTDRDRLPEQPVWDLQRATVALRRVTARDPGSGRRAGPSGWPFRSCRANARSSLVRAEAVQAVVLARLLARDPRADALVALLGAAVALEGLLALALCSSSAWARSSAMSARTCSARRSASVCSSWEGGAVLGGPGAPLLGTLPATQRGEVLGVQVGLGCCGLGGTGVGRRGALLGVGDRQRFGVFSSGTPSARTPPSEAPAARTVAGIGTRRHHWNFGHQSEDARSRSLGATGRLSPSRRPISRVPRHVAAPRSVNQPLVVPSLWVTATMAAPTRAGSA